MHIADRLQQSKENFGEKPTLSHNSEMSDTPVYIKFHNYSLDQPDDGRSIFFIMIEHTFKTTKEWNS